MHLPHPEPLSAIQDTTVAGADDPRPGREDDRLHAQVACLRTERIPFTLISTLGFHCEVWRSAGTLYVHGSSRPVDFVVKVSRRSYSLAEARVLVRDHRLLSAELEEIVPPATFILTRVDGQPGVVVMASTHPPWFDLANPGNEEEALPLLRNTRRARDQLARFVRAARRWQRAARLIDLCGVENLVLDRNMNLRFLDSFHVFLYTDLLHVVDDAGEDLAERIDIATQRLAYLEWLLENL